MIQQGLLSLTLSPLARTLPTLSKGFAEPTGFYLSESDESESHSLGCPFTVASLAALNLAVWGHCTYRIPDSGTEGCFNDLRNGRPVTVYL